MPLEEEISRILEYTVPIVEEPRRKEPSQSESQGTYLSRSRSFLAESQDLTGIPGLDELWQPEAVQEVDEEEDVGVKSWHELRRGGEDKRLLDEMEDLLEDSKAGGRLGLRRSSVLQIVEKLFNDGSWQRKFKALGLLSTFVRNVADAYSDPVCCVGIN
jgi:Wings apart-like protein regulation of heterochromatin